MNDDYEDDETDEEVAGIYWGNSPLKLVLGMVAMVGLNMAAYAVWAPVMFPFWLLHSAREKFGEKNSGRGRGTVRPAP